MTHRPSISENAAKPGCKGFTLLEIVVAVVVLGILCAAAAMNWSSFTQYQRLRADANAFHKDLMALKARAIANGDKGDAGDIGGIHVEYAAAGGKSYAISERIWNETTNGWDARATIRTVNFSGDVSFFNGAVENNGDLKALTATPHPITGISAENHWIDGEGKGVIHVFPSNIDAFPAGRVVFSSGNNQFCVQKDDTSIRPELYFRKGGGAWKKL